MLFSKSISVPLSTTAASPQRTTVELTAGILRRVWIRWRWGIGNLGGCRILYHEFQYWPLAPTQWFPSSEFPLEFEESFEISGDPSVVVVIAYNTDDSYAHTLWVAFEIEREEGVTLTAEQIRRMFLGETQVVEVQL